MPTGIYQKSRSISEYLLQRSIKNDDGCIVWVGSKTKRGYGLAKKNGISTTAHRLSFLNSKGEIPEGLEIDHLCKNILCINPDHLEAVTHLENVRRSNKAQQTHCVNGHEFTDKNTYRKPSNGCRVCRKCNANPNLRKSRRLS